MRSPKTTLLALALALGVGLAPDASRASSPAASIDEAVVLHSAFLSHHPDLRFRQLGDEARLAGRYQEALGHYQRSALHADKLSQLRIAEMYWQGKGVGRDRALAYAWMDVAAERGQSPILARRESIWEALDPSERERALREGGAIFERYGDEVAKPRMERELRRGLRRMTGSRTGSVSPGLRVQQFSGVTQMRFRHDVMSGWSGPIHGGASYYDPQLWRAEYYWQWKDENADRAIRQTRGIGTSTAAAIR